MYFEVIFTGELRAGFVRRRGIEVLAEHFSLDFRQIKHLLAGACPVVKRSLERDQAERIVKALWSGGWHSELRQGGSVLLRTNQLHGQEAPNAAAGMITKISADSSISLRLPASWQLCDGLNPRAVFQAGDHRSKQYVVVLRQQRQELPEDVSLAEYSSAQLHQSCVKVNRGDILSDPEPLDGTVYPAYVAQLHAELDRVAIRYFIVFLQWQKWYYTVFLWCESKDFWSSVDLFEQVGRTIHMQSTQMNQECFSEPELAWATQGADGIESVREAY